MTKTRLKKYANLIARCGVNVQKGQEVYITAELDQPEFVKMVVEECYKAGAKDVSVDWHYQPLTKTHVRYCSDKVLATVEKWQDERLVAQIKHVYANVPYYRNLMDEKGVKPEDIKGIDDLHKLPLQHLRK